MRMCINTVSVEHSPFGMQRKISDEEVNWLKNNSIELLVEPNKNGDFEVIAVFPNDALATEFKLRFR